MEMFNKVDYISKAIGTGLEDLDLPESKYLDAKLRYETIGKLLCKEGSPLAKYSPEIYSQGSFCLGTVIKPVNGDYDIDLVCYLNNITKNDITQKDLKQLVGNWLKQNETYKKLLEPEGNRCWTLSYANEFHLDILPSISDHDLQARGGLYSDAILITDKRSMERGTLEWPKSNPRGYAKWFYSRQEKIFKSLRESRATMLNKSIDAIPEHTVKTPLQIAVQVLKRHRDIFFNGKSNENSKPISMIITTLAALLYEGESDIFNAIVNIISKINVTILSRNGQYFLCNPVNMEENFADKWQNNPDLPKAFFEWLDNAKKVFCTDMVKSNNSLELGNIIRKSLNMKTEPLEENKSTISFPNVNLKYPKVDENNSTKPWGARWE